ncbi:hypothetical protein L3Y34_001952 [Caenorhabditis briggsae]|nr:hypothetical protein L3Y34_001952 [Caenorhabditis briggsae]
MCFSPHNDLIAMGSKSGDIMLKRTTWKMIWKTNVSMIPAVGTECKSDSTVSALHFSPDGRFIAAATDTGIIHILDVEAGKVRYSVKASSDGITKLQWERVRDDESNSKKIGKGLKPPGKNLEVVEGALELGTSIPEISREEIGFVYERLDEDGSAFKHDETQKENLERTIIPEDVYIESFQGTILLAPIDSFIPKIVVLIAGVFPFMEIDVESVVREFNQDVIMGYESVHYSSAFEGVSFIATTMGPHLDCKHKEQAPPVVDSTQPGPIVQTLVFTVKLDLEPSIWEVALRYLRLHFAYNLYSISLDTTKQNWGTQVAALHSLFDTKTKAVKIGEVLVEMLLSGSTDQAGEAFLERGLGTDGLESIRTFTSKHLPEVCRLARGQLASAARNLCFQRCEFATAMKRYQAHIKIKEDEDFLYQELSSKYQPQSNAWLNSLDDITVQLTTKTRMLGLNCLTMMQELTHLAKWISLTKPFAKTMKVNALMKIKRMEIKSILEYIVKNFFPDKKVAEEIEKKLFKLADTVKEQREKDKKEGFDEIAFLDKCEANAKVHRKKIVDKFKVKFKFDALTDENDDVAMKIDREPGTSAAAENVNPPIAMNTSKFETSEEIPPTIDLDRVGSFFEDELSEKALAVLPKCDVVFDKHLRNKGAKMNDPEIRKIGIKKLLTDLADLLCTPQKVNCDAAGVIKKPEVLFVHELCSGQGHRGYVDIKISDVTPPYFKEHAFNNLVGMKRAIQITAIEKDGLSSIVITPNCDVTEEMVATTTEHKTAMSRSYKFDAVGVHVSQTSENTPPPAQGEAMETDQNELRIDVNVDTIQAEYDTLSEYCQIHPLRHGELALMGKFKANQEGTGLLTRLMRSISSYPHANASQKDVFAVNYQTDGKKEVSIDTLIIHPTTQLTALIHDEGTKITLGDLKPEVPIIVDPDTEKKYEKKTFREYQRRREHYREHNNGSVNVNDVQYDVLVQEAMDSGRELADPIDADDDDEDDEDDDDDELEEGETDH